MMKSTSDENLLSSSDSPPRGRRGMAGHRPARIAFCSYATNAGSTTRAVEIAKACRRLLESKYGRDASGEKADMRFFVHEVAEGSNSYEKQILAAGFPVEHFEGAVLTDEMWRAFLQAERSNKGGDAFFPPPYDDLAAPFVRAVVTKLRKFDPDLVVTGLFPEVSAACKILTLKTVGYGPVPMEKNWIMRHLYQQKPAVPRTGSLRRCNPQAPPPPTTATKRQPSQSRLIYAAIECGLDPLAPCAATALDLMKTDIFLVCDLLSNYDIEDVEDLGSVASAFHFVGPIFAKSADNKVDGDAGRNGKGGEELPENAESILKEAKRVGRAAILVTMASSGETKFLAEALRAVIDGGYSAIASVPKSTCSLDELQKLIGVTIPDHILITDEFLPLDEIAPRVQAVVCHGGQGTVQTVLAAGTPLVGVPLQREQAFNLRGVAKWGAGAWISKKEWTASSVGSTLEVVMGSDSYRRGARRAKREMEGSDGRADAARIILRTAGLEA